MAESQTRMKKGGKNMTTSVSRKEHYSFYKTHTYALHKLKKIIPGCGAKFAQTWARKHAAELVLSKLLK
jgi:hypothetical protein